MFLKRPPGETKLYSGVIIDSVEPLFDSLVSMAFFTCPVLFNYRTLLHIKHYNGVTMSDIASQITSLAIVYSTVYSDSDQRKLQSPASLAFVRGICRWPVNSPHKGPVTRKMFAFDDVIMWFEYGVLFLSETIYKAVSSLLTLAQLLIRHIYVSKYHTHPYIHFENLQKMIKTIQFIPPIILFSCL